MFSSTPMTVIVVLVLITCGLIGLRIIYGVMSRAAAGRKGKVCGRCRTRNPVQAKFCAQCGKPLDGR